MSEADFDIFFYVLENGIDSNIVSLAGKSFGYCRNNGIDFEKAPEIIHNIISRNFAPLQMFPHTQHSLTKVQPVFDVDWLTSLVAKVHAVTGKDIDFIMKEMSLNAACYYFIQYARQQGTQNIERRPPEEILRAKDIRACEIITEYLLSKGKLKPEEKDEFFKTISTPPENK